MLQSQKGQLDFSIIHPASIIPKNKELLEKKIKSLENYIITNDMDELIKEVLEDLFTIGTKI